MRFLRDASGRLRLRRLGVLLLPVLAAAGAAFLAIESGWAAERIRIGLDRALSLSARAGFAVGKVVDINRQRTSPADIRNAVGAVIGAPILAVDIHAIRSRVEALPWVQQAVVERRLPDTLVVRLVEREVLAVWDRGEDFVTIDRDGKPIAGIDPRGYAHLPVVRGAEAAANAPAILAILENEPDIAWRVTGLSYVSGRRWNVHLDWRIEIKLPEESPGAAWARLAQTDRERRLLEGDIAHIDMRFDDRMVLRMAGNRAGERS